MEQTVCRNQTATKRAGNILLSIFAVFSLLIAAVFTAALVSFNAESGFKINWLALIGVIAFILLAYFLRRKKDAVCIDYDYSFCCGEISISAIYNSRRRKSMLNLPLGNVRMCGSTETAAFTKLSANKNIIQNKWFANEDSALYFFLYEQDSRQCVAVLELNDCMACAVKKSKLLANGTWNDREGT